MDKDILIKFIYKYTLIINAVSRGWIVKYIGKNKFQFYQPKKIYRMNYDNYMTPTHFIRTLI